MAVEYIKDLKALIDFLKVRVEIIIYPAGDEGQLLLDFVSGTGRLKRVICVATDGNSSANDVTHGRSVIPLRVMQHFRETANFLIAAPTSEIESMHERLNAFGCKMIFAIDAKVYDAMRVELEKINAPDDMLMRSINDISNRLNHMDYYGAWRNEIYRTNTAAFGEYRNKFWGKKVVICGCGPTLKDYKPIPDAVHISLNRAFLSADIPFDYLFAHDAGGGKKAIKVSTGFDKIRGTAFIGKFAKVSGGLSFSENISIFGDKVSRYFIDTNSIAQPIYQDICSNPLTDFWSIFSAALQFAFFTGPSELYLAGCDVSMGGHFYQYTAADSSAYWLNTPVVKVGYARFKLFGEQYYPHTKVISINPVGLKGLFEDVYTEE